MSMKIDKPRTNADGPQLAITLHTPLHTQTDAAVLHAALCPPAEQFHTAFIA